MAGRGTLRADRAHRLGVLALIQLVVGCAHAAGARSSAAPHDIPSAYREWLAGSGLSGALSVRSYDSDGQHLELSATDQYPVLLVLAKEGGLDLPRKLYLKLRQLLPRAARGAHLSIKGGASCDAAEVREQDGDILVQTEGCRSDAIEISADLVAAITKSPAGKLTTKESAQVINQLIRGVKAYLRDQGQFSLIFQNGTSASFEVQGMRGQVLEGEKWWERVQVHLSIQSGSSAEAPAIIAWQASGRYGSGFRAPPSDGYNADMEPAHAKALSKYVSKLLTMIVQDLQLSRPQEG